MAWNFYQGDVVINHKQGHFIELCIRCGQQSGLVKFKENIFEDDGRSFLNIVKLVFQSAPADFGLLKLQRIRWYAVVGIHGPVDINAGRQISYLLSVHSVVPWYGIRRSSSHKVDPDTPVVFDLFNQTGGRIATSGIDRICDTRFKIVEHTGTIPAVIERGYYYIVDVIIGIGLVAQVDHILIGDYIIRIVIIPEIADNEVLLISWCGVNSA